MWQVKDCRDIISGIIKGSRRISNGRHNVKGEDGKDAAIPLGQTEGAGIAGPGTHVVVPA